MAQEKLGKPSDDLDALLDDALDAFDTEENLPARIPPAPAPSPANPPSLDSNQTASSSKTSKAGLAFDPLGARGRKTKPPHPPTSGTAAAAAAAAAAGPSGLPEEEYNGEDLGLGDVSAGLSQLLAELARANMGPVEGEDAGLASSEENDLGGGSTIPSLQETLKALNAQNAAAFSRSGEEDTIPDDLLEKLGEQLRGMEGMEGLEGLLPPELLLGGGAGGAPGGAGLGGSSGGAQPGEFPGMASLVDTIMHQLLSKDVLYQPMKNIGGKYPEWLAANKESLDPEQYKQYEEQYEYIQKICTMYETEPENYPKLMDLLQEMQQRGQPPQEIIDELAPGMTFGPDGLPSMGGSGSQGLPGGIDPAECCIQ